MTVRLVHRRVSRWARCRQAGPRWMTKPPTCCEKMAREIDSARGPRASTLGQPRLRRDRGPRPFASSSVTPEGDQPHRVPASEGPVHVLRKGRRLSRLRGWHCGPAINRWWVAVRPGHVRGPYFRIDILEHPPRAAHASKSISMSGGSPPFGRNEALEQKIAPHRIDLGDAEAEAKSPNWRLNPDPGRGCLATLAKRTMSWTVRKIGRVVQLGHELQFVIPALCELFRRNCRSDKRVRAPSSAKGR